MDDVDISGLDEMFDQILGLPGHSQAVLGVEEKIKRWKTMDLNGGHFSSMLVGKGGGVNMDFVAQLGEFLGEDLGGSGNAVDAGKVGVGNKSDFQRHFLKDDFTTELTELHRVKQSA